ncbi:alpha-amylase family glycosyl hydrolase, partial [Leifsonia poae]|uniref:alpha-amylase family glycosyl hydrolase n=1 Tax=Leifsonia poae TaxID=110933 RepID=UPI00403EC572
MATPVRPLHATAHRRRGGLGAAERRIRYATEQGLGQAFNFDLLKATWDAAQFRRIVEENLDLSAQSGSSSTWVFSNHDMVRHATRFGLPPQTARATRGSSPMAWNRGRTATWACAALTPPPCWRWRCPAVCTCTKVRSSVCRRSPTSPATTARIPRSSAPEVQEIGRDGCRVPLPWTADGPSFGFGAGGAHLPQPAWFAEFAVDTQSGRSGSVLSLYQDALAGRRMLQTDERLEWLDIAPDVVAFRRPNAGRPRPTSALTPSHSRQSASTCSATVRPHRRSRASRTRHHRLVPAWLRRHSS